jgi:hypothetical protein
MQCSCTCPVPPLLIFYMGVHHLLRARKKNSRSRTRTSLSTYSAKKWQWRLQDPTSFFGHAIWLTQQSAGREQFCFSCFTWRLKKKIEVLCKARNGPWKIVQEDLLPRRDFMSTNKSLALLGSTWKVQPRGVVVNGCLGIS